MRFEFHPEALVEFDDAADHYAGRQDGLAVRFVDAVQTAISHITADPHRFRLFDGETRRCLVDVFPYAVIYSVEDDLIFIIAVMHCSREPEYWKNRKEQSRTGEKDCPS